MRNTLLNIRSVIQNKLLKNVRSGDLFGPRSIDLAAERRLSFYYRDCIQAGTGLPGLDQTGYRVFSQHDEDGILQFLLSVLGEGDRRCVEIGIGDGTECNTTHLLVNHGWHGLMLDMSAAQVARAKRWFASIKDTRYFTPEIRSAQVCADNVNTLLTDCEFFADIDLLSIDIDSVDYWVLSALEARPRILVLEVRGLFPADRSLTIPPDATPQKIHREFYGASLQAFATLADVKGYRLVGVNKHCSNAFFVRRDLGVDVLPSAEVDACLTKPRARRLQKTLWPELQNLPWAVV